MKAMICEFVYESGKWTLQASLMTVLPIIKLSRFSTVRRTLIGFMVYLVSFLRTLYCCMLTSVFLYFLCMLLPDCTIFVWIVVPNVRNVFYI